MHRVSSCIIHMNSHTRTHTQVRGVLGVLQRMPDLAPTDPRAIHEQVMRVLLKVMLDVTAVEADASEVRVCVCVSVIVCV
jgi:hypothetical protein